MTTENRAATDSRILQWTTTRERPWQTQSLRAGSQEPVNLALTGETAQTMLGFGGCFNELGWDALGLLPEAEQKRILESLFADDGCRFSFCRLPIGASDYAREWYSLNEHRDDYEMEHFSIDRDQESLIPYVRAAQSIRPEIDFFASPWSPPTWMKTPAAYNHGVLRWEKRVLEAYALYFRRYVEAYVQEGIPVRQIHVQNEPVSDQKFPSCVWTGEQFCDFIGNYLGPEFEEHAVPADIWLGTLNGPETDARWWWTRYDQYANLVLTDPKAARYVKGVAYQWAGKYAIQRTHEAWPDLPLIQSENECGDGQNSWLYAMYVFELLWHYLTNHATAYVYWNMILERGGRSTWGWNQNSMITVDPQTRRPAWEHEFYVMKHFSHFIDPGAVRLRLRGSWTGNALMFRNPDGVRILVIANPFAEARALTVNLGAEQFSSDLQPSSINTFVIRDV
jgi:glucosylceramidase